MVIMVKLSSFSLFREIRWLYAWWNVQVICFKFCHNFGIGKPRWNFAFLKFLYRKICLTFLLVTDSSSRKHPWRNIFLAHDCDINLKKKKPELIIEQNIFFWKIKKKKDIFMQFCLVMTDKCILYYLPSMLDPM